MSVQQLFVNLITPPLGGEEIVECGSCLSRFKVATKSPTDEQQAQHSCSVKAGLQYDVSLT